VLRATDAAAITKVLAGKDTPVNGGPPGFDFKGGLGLVCDKGAAVFRNVVLSPLPDED
jgi:hypothetical protein